VGYTVVEALAGWKQAAREGGIDSGSPPKTEHRGSVFVNEMCGMAHMYRGNCPGVGEHGIVVVGFHNRLACEGGWIWAPSQNPSRWDSVWLMKHQHT
jgi:hypothetical protein